VVFNVDGRFYAIEDRFNTSGIPAATVPHPSRYYTVRASGNDIQLEL
jgi:hypothetical protein